METKTPAQILRWYYLINTWVVGICTVPIVGYTYWVWTSGEYLLLTLACVTLLYCIWYLIGYLPRAKQDLHDGIITERCLVMEVRTRRRRHERWMVRTTNGTVTLENQTAMAGARFVETTVELTYGKRTRMLLAVEGRYCEPEDDLEMAE